MDIPDSRYILCCCITSAKKEMIFGTFFGLAIFIPDYSKTNEHNCVKFCIRIRPEEEWEYILDHT